MVLCVKFVKFVGTTTIIITNMVIGINQLDFFTIEDQFVELLLGYVKNRKENL